MRGKALQNALYGLTLAVWVGSFFLPSINLGAHDDPGYKACAISATMLFTISSAEVWMHLYFGSFWIANFFMLGSPVALHRRRRGKGHVFLALMLFWDLLTLSFVGYDFYSTHRMAELRAGYWVWEASLVAMTVVLWVAGRFKPPNKV